VLFTADAAYTSNGIKPIAEVDKTRSCFGNERDVSLGDPKVVYQQKDPMVEIEFKTFHRADFREDWPSLYAIRECRWSKLYHGR